MPAAQHPALQVDNQQVRLSGAWITLQLDKHLTNQLQTVELPHDQVNIDCADITQMDTNGACVLNQFLSRLKDTNVEIDVQNLQEEYQDLLDIAASHQQQVPAPKTSHVQWLERIGHTAIQQYGEMKDLLAFLGEVATVSLQWICHPQRIRWVAVVNGLDKTGYQAIGIIALLSFLIGVVLSYQMGLQLETYGASIYVVDLLGLSILREFAPLLTAIIVAGRTGSAYAAQLGTMKLNQEIDALNTFGISPTELLVLPKMSCLLIALPLLSVLSMMAGIFGGMVMAKIMFGLNFNDFLARFGDVIPVKTLILGIIKTPVFAVLIATVGCFQGFRVSGSAESVGLHTTISVVQSIFLIIVTDAVFSIVYSQLGL